MLQNFLLAFIPLFVAIDAIGNLPIFLSLTGHLDDADRKRIARTSVSIATAIVIIFLLGGNLVFRLMGITLVDIQVAGGILLLAFSIQMLLGGKAHTPGSADVAIFPLASPLLAGPAVLTMTLVLSKSFGWTITLMSVLINMAIVWLVFRHAKLVERIITRNGMKAFSKVVEILLAAIAVMMIRRGLMEFFETIG